jgi:hypothetical protein
MRTFLLSSAFIACGKNNRKKMTHLVFVNNFMVPPILLIAEIFVRGLKSHFHSSPFQGEE